MNSIVRNDLGRNGFQARWTNVSSPGWGDNNSGTINAVRSKSGTVQYSPYSIPGWRQLIATNQDATTLLIGQKSKVEASTQFTFRTIFGYPGGNTSQNAGSGELLAIYGSIPGSPPASMPLAYALAAERFLGDYIEKTRSIRGASTLAEFGSTVRGLASPAKALRKEVSNLYQSAKRNLYRAGGPASKDAARVLGGTWTEWQFGVQPLINDVNDAARAFNKLANGDFRAVIPIRGIGVQEVVTSTITNQSVGLEGPSFGVVDTYVVDKTSVTNRGAIRVARLGGEVPIAMQFGVGFEDILPAVWEGFPWSFFWDYFFNISSVIDAWSSGLGARLAWANQTVRNSRTHVYSDVRPHPNQQFGASYQKYSCSGGHAKVSTTYVTRTKVFPDQLYPPFRLKLPQFGTKWANLAALSAMKANPFQGGVTSPPEWKPVRGTRRGTRWYRQ